MAKYDLEFEPILREGYTATLFGGGLPADGLGIKCIAIGALPEHYYDFGALTAATWKENQEDKELEMNTLELSQLRMRVLDDIKVRLSCPSAVRQWRTRAVSFYLPKFPDGEGDNFLKRYYWRVSEFFIYEDDNTPRFDLYSTIALNESRILFNGWRFKLEKLPGGQKGEFPIWINSWPTS